MQTSPQPFLLELLKRLPKKSATLARSASLNLAPRGFHFLIVDHIDHPFSKPLQLGKLMA